MERELGRFLVAIGAVIIVVGLVLWLGSGLRFGRLPGDISLSRGNLRVYVPLGTCLLISVVATVVLRVLGSR